jgi:radial spoke head protein 4A
MEQVVKARLFRRLLTGNLDAAVPSYPPFEGTERNLLRAQIARIAGATSISPDGYYDLSEEGDAVTPAEAEALIERGFPKVSSDLKDPEGWKHHIADLNRLGRVTALPAEEGEDGEPIEPEDPVEPTPLYDTIKPEDWTFRMGPGGVGASIYSVVVARSKLWPGAIAATAGRRFVNIYVGSGLSYIPEAYSPPLPAAIQTEWTAPVDEEGGALIENADTMQDPTPPKAEGEEEEE